MRDWVLANCAVIDDMRRDDNPQVKSTMSQLLVDRLRKTVVRKPGECDICRAEVEIHRHDVRPELPEDSSQWHKRKPYWMKVTWVDSCKMCHQVDCRCVRDAAAVRDADDAEPGAPWAGWRLLNRP